MKSVASSLADVAVDILFRTHSNEGMHRGDRIAVKAKDGKKERDLGGYSRDSAKNILEDAFSQWMSRSPEIADEIDDGPVGRLFVAKIAVINGSLAICTEGIRDIVDEICCGESSVETDEISASIKVLKSSMSDMSKAFSKNAALIGAALAPEWIASAEELLGIADELAPEEDEV